MAIDKDLSLAAALADTSKLEPFEGRQVARSTVAIKGAGDGLSSALAVEPRAYHQGDEVYVILKCVVGAVSFPPLSKLDDSILVRKHDFRAESATVVDANVARSHIEAQDKKIAVAKDRARGQERMVGADGDDSEVNDAAVGLSFQGGKPKKASKAQAKVAENNLRQLSKDNLRDLCDRHGIKHTARMTGAQFLDLLVGVDGIGDEAAAMHGTT